MDANDERVEMFTESDNSTLGMQSGFSFPWRTLLVFLILLPLFLRKIGVLHSYMEYFSHLISLGRSTMRWAVLTFRCMIYMIIKAKELCHSEESAATYHLLVDENDTELEEFGNRINTPIRYTRPFPSRNRRTMETRNRQSSQTRHRNTEVYRYVTSTSASRSSSQRNRNNDMGQSLVFVLFLIMLSEISNPKSSKNNDVHVPVAEQTPCVHGTSNQCHQGFRQGNDTCPAVGLYGHRFSFYQGQEIICEGP